MCVVLGDIARCIVPVAGAARLEVIASGAHVPLCDLHRAGCDHPEPASGTCFHRPAQRAL
jgi:hypothetical protein